MKNFLLGIICYFIFNQILNWIIMTISALKHLDDEDIEKFCVMSTTPISIFLFNFISKPVYQVIRYFFGYDCYRENIYFEDKEESYRIIFLVHPYKRKILSKKSYLDIIYNGDSFCSKNYWKKELKINNLKHKKGYFYYIQNHNK